MARCGCDTAQSTTCEAIMSCIAANLGPGLDYNEATGNIDLRISTDAGNIARIGSDGGFYSPASTGPGPMQWPKTVATLPAQAITATGGSNTVLPGTAPATVEYAIANDLDIFTTGVIAMADGVALDIIDGRDAAINRFTDNPSDITWDAMGAAGLPSLRYDTGTRLSPTARSAPSQFTTPDGGWAGYYHHPFMARSVAELLRDIRGRIVVVLNVRFEGLTEDADAVAAVASVVEAVVTAGAQPWTIIMPQDNFDDGSRTPLDAMMAVVTGAGITGGLNVFTEADNLNPFSPAEIVASGATWVDIAGPSHPAGASGARISEFIAAGLEVMVVTDSRQYWTDWAFDLGARSVRCGDGVYARGGRGQAGDLDYRQTFIPGLEVRTGAVGAIGPRTATRTSVSEQGFARVSEPGRWFPPRYGWEGGSALWMNHQLLGTICPIPNATDYRLRLRLWRANRGPSISTTQFGGIYFGAADDRDISAFAPSQLGYSAQVHPASDTVGFDQLSLWRHDGNGIDNQLADTDQGPGWAYEQWTDLTVTVQGATITFTATASTGTATISANDATYRGPYACYVWYDTTANPLLHAYSNPLDLVMYEALS